MKKLNSSFLTVVILLVLLFTGFALFARQPSKNPLSAHAATGIPYVSGSQLMDADGHPLLLRGAQVQGAFDINKLWSSGKSKPIDVFTPALFNAMASWHMNMVRIPVSNWIYKQDTTNYMSQLDQVVQRANAAGLYVVLDLHDNALGGSPYGANALVPKTENVDFWKAVAGHYQNNRMMMFDIFNEPHNTTWQNWLSGGGTIAGANIVGFQNLVDSIRSVGAKQPIIVEPPVNAGGNNWSSIGNYTVNDPDIIYSLHIYSGIAASPQTLDAAWGPILNHRPMYYGEWGAIVNTYTPVQCSTFSQGQADQVVNNFLNYMDSRHASWTAWEFGPYHLIQDYTTFAPTTLDIPWTCGDTKSHAGMGTVVKNYLNAGPRSKTWYFAEGRVASNFKEYLILDNPDPVATCSVNIEYLPQGSNPITKTVTITRRTRVTESVNTDLGNPSTGISVSAIVSVNSTPTCGGIVAERPMYFNFNGTASGTEMMGATSTARTFYFADVASGAGYSSFLTVLNPPGGGTATVTATYLANGGQVGQQSITIPAGTRGTISPGVISLPQHSIAVVTSNQPVVVERPQYFAQADGGIAGRVSGAVSVLGSPSLASEFLFAEGYTGNNTQENLVLSNPNAARAAATIKLKYTDGTTHGFSVSVAGKSQLIWDVNANGRGATSNEVSADVSATGATILVNRLMFFQYGHTVPGTSQRVATTGVTDVVGQVGPASHSIYNFAEGYSHGGYNEWLTVQNPTPNAETITLNLVNAYGRVYTQQFSVAADSRYTLDISALVIQHLASPEYSSLAYQVSMTVISNNNAPFVAERPMYWNTPGPGFSTQGGSDVMGYTG